MIPIETDSGIFLDPLKARAFGETHAQNYTNAAPYPHIAIDDFLPTDLANQILDNFPHESQKNAAEYALNYSGIQKNKRQVFPNDCNVFCRNLFGFFNSAPFLQFLEGLTGIDGLIADPYFNGGGFHEISTGGKLGVHADFRVNEQLHLQRRMNVLIYLNKNWQESYGGCLEIWDQSMQHKVHGIAPLFNRCVVFNTDAHSYHGHPEPLTCPPDITRKSIALYYYTASKSIYAEVPSSSTMYVSRPNEDAYAKKQAAKLRIQNYMKDFIPPVLFRMIRQLKQKMK
jgi:Rps23 Pro-64 3,4-dihydroxylase Tpa1-like proline 4-hydroxylase